MSQGVHTATTATLLEVCLFVKRLPSTPCVPSSGPGAGVPGLDRNAQPPHGHCVGPRSGQCGSGWSTVL